MPSKGRPIINARVSRELYDQILDQIELSNTTRFGEPWTVSTFTERALAEKIAKMRRSRKLRSPRLPDRAEMEDHPPCRYGTLEDGVLDDVVDLSIDEIPEGN